jgi:hypothetical protein
MALFHKICALRFLGALFDGQQPTIGAAGGKSMCYLMMAASQKLIGHPRSIPSQKNGHEHY